MATDIVIWEELRNFYKEKIEYTDNVTRPNLNEKQKVIFQNLSMKSLDSKSTIKKIDFMVFILRLTKERCIFVLTRYVTLSLMVIEK